MSYDLNVLVLNQENASVLPFSSEIQILNEFQEILRYKEIWKHMTGMRGVWYLLGVDDEDGFNAMPIIDADFNVCLKNQQMPYWVLDEDVRSNLSPLIALEKYKHDFEKILNFLIQESPSKSIMFLARYQGGETEIVCGVIKYLEFKKLLDERKILFNVCYIISER
ncbi:MAG: hypothetical protein LLG02_01630 [Pelosinus sp.]|nr:hypothetical protein [Pelosinus sp.]